MASTTLPPIAHAGEVPLSETDPGRGIVVSFPEPAQASRRESTPADTLFAAIDGRSISLCGHVYQLEVYGVTEASGARWLQLGLHGDGERLLTLRLPLGANVSRAMHALFVELAEMNAQRFELALA